MTEGGDAAEGGDRANRAAGPDSDEEASSEAGAVDEGVSPADVFECLAHEIRMGIVRELADCRRDNWAWEGMRFAELRKAVGVDDAGKFSYHLDRLRPQFVVKDGDEYKLQNHGMELAGAVEAGQYTHEGDPRRTDVEHGCPYPDCDRRLEAVYGDRFFRLECPDHHAFHAAALPPGLAEHKSLADLIEFATLERTRARSRARSGVCPHCWGPMRGTLPAADVDLPDHLGGRSLPSDAVFARFECDRCGFTFEAPPGAFVRDHPAVVSLYHDHGIDVRERPDLALPFVAPPAATVESEDPVRVRVDVELGADRLSLWLDGETDVVDYERE